MNDTEVVVEAGLDSGLERIWGHAGRTRSPDVAGLSKLLAPAAAPGAAASGVTLPVRGLTPAVGQPVHAD